MPGNEHRGHLQSQRESMSFNAGSQQPVAEAIRCDVKKGRAGSQAERVVGC